MAGGRAVLDLGPQRNNVFVTQLHEREDDDLDAQQFPVVKETGGKLLETGINTLQKTLVLKKEAELSKVDRELMEKRQDFQSRMEECAKRRQKLQQEQSAMKERVTKFDKFVQENEAKRRRAMQKYQQESRLKSLKEKEFDDLSRELDMLKRKHKILAARVKEYRKFEAYLLKVVDILPPDYIKIADNMLVGLILRHNTLADTNASLLADMNSRQDALKESREDLAKTKAEHEKNKLGMNSILSELHGKDESQKQAVEFMEQQFHYKQGDLRNQVENFGMVMRAIDNICEKCLKRYDPPLKEMVFSDKLERIRDYLQDLGDVVQQVTEEVRNMKKSA